MKFQELLEIIKKYNGNGTDYAYSSKLGGSSSLDNTKIYSPELKKEARKMVIPTLDIGDNGVCRVGATSVNGDKFYEYEKGAGSKPDRFTIKNISLDEKRKEQEKRDRERAERNKGNFIFRAKKCPECGQEIDPSKGMIASNRLNFCSVGCSKKHSDKKHSERTNKRSNDSA
ncbi:MAG: hypothetical protein NY202_00275 [Mollicutes bacterium UO1]